MRLKGPADLIAIMLFSILLVPLIIFDAGAMRIVFGLPFILFFPGYALIALLFPRRSDLGGIERIALSFGLSIAIVPLAGLLLNYVWEISLYPILVSLEAVTIGLAAGACARRTSLAAKDSGAPAGFKTKLRCPKCRTEFMAQYGKATCPKCGFSAEARPTQVTSAAAESRESRYFLDWNIPISFPEWKTYGKLDKALTIILAISILASVSVLAYVIAVPKAGEKFTEFYVLGPGGKADGYPSKMNWSENGSVIMGISNHEYSNRTYRIDAILHNESIWTEYVSLPSIPVDIDDNWTKQWETEFNFTISHPSDYRLELLLFSGNTAFELYAIDPFNAAPYRSLHLWVRDFALLDGEGNALGAFVPEVSAVCDFSREIFAEKYPAGFTINYTISAMAGGAEIANAQFAVAKINGTAANVAFAGSVFLMPGSLRIPVEIPEFSGEIEFIVLREGAEFRSAVWNA